MGLHVVCIQQEWLLHLVEFCKDLGVHAPAVEPHAALDKGFETAVETAARVVFGRGRTDDRARRNRDRCIAAILENALDGRQVFGQTHVPIVLVYEDPWVAGCEERIDRGKGAAGLGPGPVENDAVSRKAVDERRRLTIVPVGAHMVGAEGVDHDHDDVGRLGGAFRWCRVAAVADQRAAHMSGKRIRSVQHDGELYSAPMVPVEQVPAVFAGVLVDLVLWPNELRDTRPMAGLPATPMSGSDAPRRSKPSTQTATGWRTRGLQGAPSPRNPCHRRRCRDYWHCRGSGGKGFTNSEYWAAFRHDPGVQSGDIGSAPMDQECQKAYRGCWPPPRGFSRTGTSNARRGQRRMGWC